MAGAGGFTATRVGAEAYAAGLAAEASAFSLADSELLRGINRFLRLLTWIIIPVGVLLVVQQLTSDLPLAEAVVGSVAGLAPMIPEGLVLITSVAFAVGVIRLGRRRCLVQELPAVETLARVGVLCLDKTGTLTEPGMVVSSLLPADRHDPGQLRQVLAALVATDPAVAAKTRPPGCRPARRRAPAARRSGRPGTGHANLFLTKTVYALILAVMVGLAQLPYPLLPRHITLVAALTIGIPSFLLALAPSDERARSGFVPRVLRFAIPAGLVCATASLTAYLLARGGPGDRPTAGAVGGHHLSVPNRAGCPGPGGKATGQLEARHARRDCHRFRAGAHRAGRPAGRRPEPARPAQHAGHRRCHPGCGGGPVRPAAAHRLDRINRPGVGGLRSTMPLPQRP